MGLRCLTLKRVRNAALFAATTVVLSGCWAIVPSQNAPGATDELRGVSCISASNCFAVGFAGSGATSTTLTERSNGNSWSIVSSPNVPGATQNTLLAVSCTSTTNCIAVGNLLKNSTYRTLAERWDGNSWSIVSSQNPPGAHYSSLTGVFCTSATNCFAVGSSTVGATGGTLIERWNGTSWAIVSSPNTSAAENDLVGVSCSSATSCFAVGLFGDQFARYTLTEHWNGIKWSIVLSPNPAGSSDSQLAGVACPDSSSCLAVGSRFRDSDSTVHTLTERWNGASWSIEPSPNPAGSTLSELHGVSCTASSCLAVGLSQKGSTTTLAEPWNGTSWSIVATPNPTGATSSQLLGVSCPSAALCFSVGSSTKGSATSTLVEHS